MDQLEFYSQGKLLITGEYFVLLGARSLALPLKKGQQMTVDYDNGPSGYLNWISIYGGKEWFRAVFSLKDFTIAETGDHERARFIYALLQQTALLAPDFFKGHENVTLTNTLEFDPAWGLGSSSTLISNMAYWTHTDPYLLLERTTGGSGFDIACARSHGPIIYAIEGKQPAVNRVDFKPAFRKDLYFIYLGKKESTTGNLTTHKRKLEPFADKVYRISEITDKILKSRTMEEFEALIREQEAILSTVLHKTPVQEERFADYPGTVKSLGAWGGDFVMATSTHGKEAVEAYFNSKGLNVIFGYDDLVL